MYEAELLELACAHLRELLCAMLLAAMAACSSVRVEWSCTLCPPLSAVVRITNPLDHVTHEVELKIHPGE